MDLVGLVDQNNGRIINHNVYRTEVVTEIDNYKIILDGFEISDAFDGCSSFLFESKITVIDRSGRKYTGDFAELLNWGGIIKHDYAYHTEYLVEQGDAKRNEFIEICELDEDLIYEICEWINDNVPFA